MVPGHLAVADTPGQPGPMWKRTAGLWGPLGFSAATLLAARRQPSYSHQSNHVSGLASWGEQSASIMVPGFVALAAAQFVLPAPAPILRRLYRLAALTTALAGVVRVSDPLCPRPGVDTDATASDLGHGAASLVTFGLWTAIPVVASRQDELPRWYRRAARLAIAPTIATLIAAGVTTFRGSPSRGIAAAGVPGVGLPVPGRHPKRMDRALVPHGLGERPAGLTADGPGMDDEDREPPPFRWKISLGLVAAAQPVIFGLAYTWRPLRMRY